MIPQKRRHRHDHRRQNRQQREHHDDLHRYAERRRALGLNQGNPESEIWLWADQRSRRPQPRIPCNGSSHGVASRLRPAEIAHHGDTGRMQRQHHFAAADPNQVNGMVLR